MTSEDPTVTALGEPEPELCQRVRVNEMESVVVGPQQVPYTCNRLVTMMVLDHQGTEHRLCDECAPEVATQVDRALCEQWSTTVMGWAQQVGHRPELADWLTHVAATLAGITRDDD